VIRKLCQFLLLVTAVVSLWTTNSQAQSMLTHHVREATRSGEAKAIGRLPQDQIMQLDIVLPLRDPAGLGLFLKELYDPSSPSYRQFLTPSEFTGRFGPSQEDYDAAVSFSKASGFTIVGGTRDGMEIQVKGSVAVIEKAFHVTMLTYQHPTENRVFYAPDTEPTTSLPFPLWHVSGLDDYSIPHTRLVSKYDYAAAHGIAPEDVVSHATTGSGPSSSFLGSDMRAAYYGGTALTGAGQNLGLFEFEGTDLADLTTYFTNVGQTNNVPVTLLSVDGTSTSCVYSSKRCDDGEQTLDMTQAIGMAPGLASLVMYVGSTDTAIISAMTTHNPLPTTIGCSWGWTPADASTLDPYFQKMASQGQNFFAASGDSSTWSSSNEAWPADDAYVVSVGGTDLVTASAAGPWKSETAWTDSGGGISPDSIAIPAWQQLTGVINSSNKGSTTLRSGPDVSANANFTFYTCSDQKACQANVYGGTSFAAPMWAGYIALVNQQLVTNGQPTIGFINPTIYAQNITSSYATDFHDITSGTSGSYSAVTGFDLVTGWGSPNGVGLINALAATQKTSQTITFPNPGPLTYPSSPNTVTLTATASSGLAVTYTVTSGPGTISGSVLTVTGTGTIVVTASQAGNSTYSAATPVADSIVVSAATAATLASPVTGSTLTGASTTFTWASNGSTTPVYLWVGSTSGGNDLVNVGPLSGTSTTVTLPTNGAPVYATLWSTLSSNLVSTTASYTEASLLPASISTPASGSTLTAAATTFTWTANGSTTPVYLWVGSTSGGNDLANVGPLSGTSTTVTLPTSGAKVYVRLYSTLNGNLVYNSYTYTSASLLPASIQTPASGSTLGGAATTFTWAANGSTTPVYLWIGSTSGGNDLANVGPLSGTSTTVTLPTNGAPVYVRLYSTLNGNLVYNSYTYTEASLLAASIQSPANGSTLSAQQTFTWTSNGSTTPVYMWIGSTLGGNDLVNIGPLSGTSTTVSLPTDGNPVYVTLWSTLNGNLVSTSSVYTDPSSGSNASKGVKSVVTPRR
jgi:kumamolisin